MFTDNLAKEEHIEQKRTGPKMDPCGTPDVIATDAEEYFPMLTERFYVFKYKR